MLTHAVVADSTIRKDDLPGAAVVLCAEYRCIKPATKTIYAEFTNFAIPYDACDEHYAHAGTRSYMTFRIKDGLLVGYRDGIITQVTDKRLRTV